MRLQTTMKFAKAAALVSCIFSSTRLLAQDVRLVQQNGTQFVESRQTVREPVTQNKVDRYEETVYKEEFVTRVQESQQTYYAPVTEYRWEPRVHGRLNPLRPNTIAYHLVPHTRWEPRTHTIRTPVTYRQVRPETRVVETPRRQLGFAHRQQTSRTALAPNGSSFSSTTTTANNGTAARVATRHHALSSAAPSSAGVGSAPAASSRSQVAIPRTATLNLPIGGVHQMDGDHPRYGAMPSSQRY